MPFPYAYYQDNYNGPVHATVLKTNALKIENAPEIISSGDIDAFEKTSFIFNTSGSNIIIDSLLNVQAGQFISIIKKVPANSLTLKHNSTVGSGVKFFSRSGTDIVLNSGRLGAVCFYAIQDQAILKLYEINNASIFPELQNALNLKANTASPVFTGTPIAPTQIVTDNSSKIATTAFVKGSINEFISNVLIPGISIDWTLGSTFHKEIFSNTTFELINETNGKTISIIIKNSGTSVLLVDFGSHILKPENTSFEIDAGKESIYTLIRSNNKTYMASVSNLS